MAASTHDCPEEATKKLRLNFGAFGMHAAPFGIQPAVAGLLAGWLAHCQWLAAWLARWLAAFWELLGRFHSCLMPVTGHSPRLSFLHHFNECSWTP